MQAPLRGRGSACPALTTNFPLPDVESSYRGARLDDGDVVTLEFIKEMMHDFKEGRRLAARCVATADATAAATKLHKAILGAPGSQFVPRKLACPAGRVLTPP